MAIAFDAAASGAGARNATSLTYGHTCTGSNVTLVVGVYTGRVGGADPSGVTYNGNAMTFVDSGHTDANGFVSTWVISVGAADGISHNVVVSGIASTLSITAGSISLTGTAAIQNGAHGKIDATTTTTPSVSVTTTVANSWVVAALGPADTLAVANPVVSGSTVQKYAQNSDPTTGQALFGGYLPTTTTGTYAPSWTSNSSRYGGSAVEILPFASATINSSFLAFM